MLTAILYGEKTIRKAFNMKDHNLHVTILRLAGFFLFNSMFQDEVGAQFRYVG